MSDNRSKIDNPKFHYWMKTGLALMYTKEGVHDTICNEIEKLQKKALSDILTTLNLPPNTACSNCSTEQIVCNPVFKDCKHRKCSNVHKSCPKDGLCERFRDKIIQIHRFNDPSWKNTDAKQWYDDSWQIAKCFMPNEGYRNTKSFEETDFNGVISVIINYKGFKNIITENLSQRNNVFCKAREISNKFRHSAIFEIAEEDFNEYIKILEKILTDPKYLASQISTKVALEKITKLCNDSWTITPAKDFVSVLNEELHYNESDAMVTADRSRTEKYTLLWRNAELMINKLEDVEDAMSQLRISFNHFDKRLKKQEFAERLVVAYRDKFSTLPISALVEEEDAQLLEFFARPTMKLVDHHNIKSQSAHIRSYKDIFFKKGQLCRNIYVTGDAGIGKTAFCQRMVLAWCHAKSGGREDHNFSTIDIDEMKQFSFLFYVTLRETKLCHVKEMIQKQLQDFDSDIIAQILDQDNCLIILDGLDEWTHQTVQGTCPSDRKLPHRSLAKNCTYLTTTRPWKLEGNRLKTNEIDQQVELEGLGKHSCRELTISVIKHLNNKLEMSREPEHFQQEVAMNRLDTVCEVPIVLMQLICLWFDERTLGTSRCSIYAETLEMLFIRAPESEDVCNVDRGKIHKAFELPDCLKSLQAVSENINLLYKLGQLAFEGLFGKSEKESELIFDSSRGKIFDISETEMNYLLNVGILSKNKVVGTLSKRKLKLSFLHKSYQEFLAAVYIALQADDNIVTRIFTTCKTLRIFLGYENVFLFLSGMCPDVFSKFSDRIKSVFRSDKQVCIYRRYADYKFGFVVMLPPFSMLTDPKFVDVRDAERLLQTYQTLVLHCQEECQRSCSRSIFLPIEDVFLGETYSEDLHVLLVANKDNIKSFSAEKYCDDLLDVKYIEKVSLNFCKDGGTHGEDMDKYESCLNLCKQTLTCLSVSNARGIFDLCRLQLPNLKSIDLYNIILQHREMSILFKFISDKTDLIQILLFQIKCSDHEEDCTGSTLNLLHHNELDFLRLHRVFEFGQHKTRVNCTKLETFIFEDSRKATENTSLLIVDLLDAPCLTELTLLGISSKNTFESLLLVIPSLIHLKRLSLYNCNFGENHVELNPKSQRNIVNICLLNSSITYIAFCKFVDSIPLDTEKVISVHMQSCKILKDNSETSLIKGVEDYLNSKSNFHVYICKPFKLHFAIGK